MVGAESTGKTSLVKALSEQVGAVVVPEVLREFVQLKGRLPTQGEQLQILQAQMQAENAAVETAVASGLSLVLCDSSAIMTAVYSDFYFGDQTLYAPALDHHARVSLTLFCHPDLPWVADPGMRDGPSTRQAIHKKLAERLQTIQSPVVPIVGEGDHRLGLALRALGALH